MCEIWTAEEWQQNSQPVTRDSRYAFDTTRYSENGEAARVYSEIDGWFWAVLPGRGNDTAFRTKGPLGGYDNPRAAALEYLADRGYTLEDDPTKATPAPDAEVEYVISALATNLV